MESIIRDLELAPSGRKKISWAQAHMPMLNHLKEKYAPEQIFKGLRMVVTIHLEAKTAYLAKVFASCGGNVVVTGSNPLSTQDDVAAALVNEGIAVFATHACTPEEYDLYLERALDSHPHLIVDDGGDLVHMLHGKRRGQAAEILGGSEETTTGVMRLKALDAAERLLFPMIAVNNSDCKYLFDNRYGTGQSAWEGVIRATNLSLAGSTCVVAGYGWCGKGAAMRAKGLGANVIVTEVDPIKGVEAAFDGFRVLPMQEAARYGDFFLTVTGCRDVIRREHMEVMKDGVVLANAGHFDVEVSKPDLEALSVKEPYEARAGITTYTLANGHRLNLLGEGRLVNLACGDGHAVEIMDLSFAMQFLAMRHILQNHNQMQNRLYVLPHELDEEIAELKLHAMGYGIDKLSPGQEAYLRQA